MPHRLFATSSVNHIHLTGILLLLAVACAHKPVASIPAKPIAFDNSFTDLAPNGHLRIVVPVLSSGSPVTAGAIETSGNTIALSVPSLIGYDISHFILNGRRDGRVRLHFTSAEISRNGQTVVGSQVPTFTFLPPGTALYIRLIYLTRSSQADHNMAVVASKSKAALANFTDELRAKPDICRTSQMVFCSWVPQGVAVRPE